MNRYKNFGLNRSAMRAKPTASVLVVFLSLWLNESQCVDSPASITLIADGNPQATIVVSPTESKSIDFAVRELNDHLEKITGARLPVVRDDQTVSGPRVLVGESAATRALGLSSSDFADQEYLVRATPDTLILMGKDDLQPRSIIQSAGDAWNEGKWGKALLFNGRGRHVFQTQKHGFYDIEGTLECWIYLDDSPATEGAILRLTNDREHVILLRVGNHVRYRSIHNGKESFLHSKPLTVGWHHVMATHSYQTKRIELIVDGESQGTAPYVKTSVASGVLFIGGFFTDDYQTVWTPLHGLVDEIRISRTVRPPKVPRTPFLSDGDTTLLLHFDEGTEAPVGIQAVADSNPETLALLPDMFSNMGTLHAIYDFLERTGVRWYTPGDIGLVFDRQPTLVVPPIDIKRSPSMKYRHTSPFGGMMYTDLPAHKYSRYDRSVWKLRLREGGEKVLIANHSFEGFYNRFSKDYGLNRQYLEQDRPELFAKGLTVSQMLAPEGRKPNLCYSSPALVEQVVTDAREFFDGKELKPGSLGWGKYYGLGPMDMAPYCQCPTCLATRHAPKDDIDRGYASDYWFGFVNKVARELHRTHPGKLLSVLAYHDYAEPPASFTLEPNITVTITLLGPSMYWDPARKERDRRAFDEGWMKSEKDKRSYYVWLYLVGGMMGQDSDYPDACAGRIPAFMQKLYADGIKGLTVQYAAGERYSFLVSQLELYLTMKLADDRSLDAGQATDEFFERYYGPSGNMMKRLYLEMEEVKFDLQNFPDDVRRGDHYSALTPEIVFRHLLTPQRVERWSKLMDQALAISHGVYNLRIQQYKTGVWDRMTAARDKHLANP